MELPVKTPAPSVVRIEVAPVTLAYIVAAVTGLWLLYQLWIVVLLVVVALVFVGTFNPVVESMEARGLKRSHALVLLILALLLGSALLIFLTVPPMIDQFSTIVQDLPGQRLKLIAALGNHGITTPLSQALKNAPLDMARLQTHVVGYWADAFNFVGYVITTIFLAFYFLADGKRTQGALYALVPRHYHMRLARIIHNLELIVGGYMRGQLITSVALAGFTFLLLTACGVRNALALGLLAALLDVVPFVGGLLAAIPVVLTALGHGQNTAVIVAVGMFIYQEFENKILVPKVYEHALRLSPAAVVLALIAGGVLMGMLGALLALPIAAGLQMILEELRVALPGDDSNDAAEREANQRTEDAYKLMSAGASAPDAGQIATDLAHDIRAADAWVAARQAKAKTP